MPPSPARRPVGRFAPSPSGPLHFGSLVAAVGSYLEARAHGGLWLVRMEDVDTPRTVAGAADRILATLERCGLEWDGEVLYQSTRNDAYHHSLERLLAAGHAFPCACSRREVGDGVYPGTCRRGLPPGRRPRSVRVVTAGAAVEVDDPVQGPYRQDLEVDVGDFVVRRADGLFAYQLAVVVDDADQGVTQVVRGSDLLDSTPRQVHLQRLLGLPRPAYAHLPVAANRVGQKLSKQTRAAPIDPLPVAPLIGRALAFLGHPPPRDLAGAPAGELLAWARGAWRLERVPRALALPADPEGRPAYPDNAPSQGP